MQVTEFLSTVLPPPGHGYYCAVELTTKHREHKFVKTLEELYEAATSFDSAKRDTYFALSTYEQSGSRTATNSRYIRSLFCDIDVGESKPYQTVESAIGAVEEWSARVLSCVPAIVLSGGGVHCYWPFSEAVPVGEWRPVAEAFKRACAAGNLGIDYSVSADSARVLRVPGTSNRKQKEPRPVSIYRPFTADSIPEFGTYARLLEQFKEEKQAVGPRSPIDLGILGEAPAYAKSGASFVSELAEISQNSFERLVSLGDDGCKQIMGYLRNPQQDGAEPLWRACISVAKYCIEGEEKCFELSAMHPYDHDRAAKKIADLRGPYGCEAFAGAVSGVCEKCTHYKKIKNPIVLARVPKQQAPKEMEITVEGESVLETLPAAPENFSFHPSGIKFSNIGADGVLKHTNVCDVVLYATATYDRAGERFVQFTHIEHGQKKSTVVPMVVVTSKDDSIKAFSKIGVMVYNGQEALFRVYLKQSLALAKQRPPTLMPTSLGWQEDDTFAFDNRIFSPSGEVEVPMYGFENISETTGTRGTLDGWRLVIAAMLRTERWDIVSMLGIGFAAPLMKFTGLNGVTFHICSNGSGHGKTLCQRLASSVWGVPDKFRTAPNTSGVAMINRLGMLGSLPLMVDEITHKGRNDTEWFPEFLSQMSDGRGKDRMEASANAERRNTTTWASIALMTSNKHMLDYLTAERVHGSEGEIRRLVELTFEQEFETDEFTKNMLFNALPENYGVAGEAYARWLVRNPEVARKVTKDTYAEVFQHFAATGDERFWIAGCACILAGFRLAGKKHANIVDIPISKVAHFLLETITVMRSETRRMKRTAEDVLNEFTKRNFGKLVFVNGRMAKIAGMEVAETLDRHDLCGRVEKGAVEGWLDYYIEERELKAFCSSLSFGYSEFKKSLTKESGTIVVAYLRKDLLSGTKGPSMTVRCIHIKQKVNTSLDIFNKTAFVAETV